MLTTASVKGLLGEFDHTIKLEADWQFAIAYGLNGVGKTRFLELINAVVNLNYDRLAASWFTTLKLTDDTGSSLFVSKIETIQSEEALDEDVSGSIVYQFSDANRNESIEWAAPVADDIAIRKRVARLSPYVPVPGVAELWRDPSDGELIEWGELRRRYGAPRNRRLVHAGPPAELQAFLDRNTTYLIETQRLTTIPIPSNRHRPDVQSSPQWNVDAYAGDLKQRIERSLADNSLASQRLDRSFPKRIIDQHVEDALTEEAIRSEYQSQDERRERLVGIGLTSAGMDVPLPDRALAPWQRAVLTTYLKDNAEKLSTFDDLLRRITLLEELVNARFLRKRIVINADNGLTVESLTTGHTLPPSGLSTGEQHELVLMYNLLFRVKPGALVLIDEPEISLHVTWQKNFIADVSRVAELRGFRFVVATHSPQIIGAWWSRTKELGPREDAE